MQLSQQVQKVVDAVKLVHERRPELMVEGPLQYDAGWCGVQSW
jgi:phosphotransacetylase